MRYRYDENTKYGNEIKEIDYQKWYLFKEMLIVVYDIPEESINEFEVLMFLDIPK